MKNKFLTRLAILLCGMAVLPACSKVLDQELRSSLDASFFSTPIGLEGGVTAAYSNLRALWGTEGFSHSQNAGTDELRRGNGGGLEYFNYSLTTADGTVAGTWNTSYQSINNLNGILEFGPAADIPADKKTRLLAEAKFLRAWYYFHLVQTFGDLPLNLTFIQSPTTTATREPIAEVYAAIIKDLQEAVAELPARPTGSTGRASKASALFLLSKVYLTRGWSSAAQATDFQTSYTTALQLINAAPTLGFESAGLRLWQDFANVHKKGNEYLAESIWVVDRMNDNTYGESIFENGFDGRNNKANGLAYFWRPLYTNPLDVNFGIPGASANSVNTMDRDLLNGRPFLRYRPLNYLLDIAFGERVNDSRYDKTFQTAWIFNRTASVSVTRNGLTTPWVINTDTAIWMPGKEVSTAERQASRSRIIAPSQYNGDFFPSMRKHDDPTRPTVNSNSTRPFMLMRLAEVYLIAAEAYFKDNKPAEAANMLNVIRKRAAYRSNYSPAQLAAAEAAMQITPAQVTLDFILEERSRELYGENVRWNDLVRTKTLLTRVAAYNPEAAAGIRPHHILRPIPQAQIDLTSGAPFPQNLGY
jgi:hypothetical protein